MTAFHFKTLVGETMQAECRFFSDFWRAAGPSAAPVGGDVPEGAVRFGQRFFGGEADVAQKVIIELREGGALVPERAHLREALQQAQAAGGVGGCGADRAIHDGFFHAEW